MISNCTSSQAIPSVISSRNHENFISLSIQNFQTIVQDTFERLADCQNNPNNQVLEKGAWYAHDYYSALKKAKQEKRLK
ncbi:hypothetical protein PNK_0548 [Candidatus Protochlamydia naegleriophila]|uniref:Uncharacterized protein n=1 Tax=Candidatus Protochlamydia naegleriophila TaxID=389348 RepID=A0A0U5EPZ2_9BACT|nr:hypothetical protein [Candidatus Protochlamydia naegleriophila]CUI16176.1 hypothetical protein PNK_0548 [Candidatus Protochlamydia naegleriophila]